MKYRRSIITLLLQTMWSQEICLFAHFSFPGLKLPANNKSAFVKYILLLVCISPLFDKIHLQTDPVQIFNRPLGAEGELICGIFHFPLLFVLISQNYKFALQQRGLSPKALANCRFKFLVVSHLSFCKNQPSGFHGISNQIFPFSCIYLFVFPLCCYL